MKSNKPDQVDCSSPGRVVALLKGSFEALMMVAFLELAVGLKGRCYLPMLVLLLRLEVLPEDRMLRELVLD
jgi:hypothetical protein